MGLYKQSSRGKENNTELPPISSATGRPPRPPLTKQGTVRNAGSGNLPPKHPLHKQGSSKNSLQRNDSTGAPPAFLPPIPPSRASTKKPPLTKVSAISDPMPGQAAVDTPVQPVPDVSNEQIYANAFDKKLEPEIVPNPIRKQFEEDVVAYLEKFDKACKSLNKDLEKLIDSNIKAQIKYDNKLHPDQVVGLCRAKYMMCAPAIVIASSMANYGTGLASRYSSTYPEYTKNNLYTDLLSKGYKFQTAFQNSLEKIVSDRDTKLAAVADGQGGGGIIKLTNAIEDFNDVIKKIVCVNNKNPSPLGDFQLHIKNKASISSLLTVKYENLTEMINYHEFDNIEYYQDISTPLDIDTPVYTEQDAINDLGGKPSQKDKPADAPPPTEKKPAEEKTTDEGDIKKVESFKLGEYDDDDDDYEKQQKKKGRKDDDNEQYGRDIDDLIDEYQPVVRELSDEYRKFANSLRKMCDVEELPDIDSDDEDNYLNNPSMRVHYETLRDAYKGLRMMYEANHNVLRSFLLEFDEINDNYRYTVWEDSAYTRAFKQVGYHLSGLIHILGVERSTPMPLPGDKDVILESTLEAPTDAIYRNKYINPPQKKNFTPSRFGNIQPDKVIQNKSNDILNRFDKGEKALEVHIQERGHKNVYKTLQVIRLAMPRYVLASKYR